MNKYFIFKLLRKILAIFFFIIYLFIFLEVINLFFMAKLQFIPSILSLIKNLSLISFIFIFSILLINIIFGRIYCSILCPFGFFQELFLIKSKFSFKKDNFILLTFIIILFLISLFYFNVFIGFLDPYSIFGKFVTIIIKPIIIEILNFFHNFLPFIPHFSTYNISLPIIIVTGLIFLFLFLFSIKFGKTFCNFLCPVGIIFRPFSKYSLLNLKIDEKKCIKCNLCTNNCPALCIDLKNTKLDYSRCFLCLECFKCPTNAINFSMSEENIISKRLFISSGKKFIISFIGLFLIRNKLFSLIKEKNISFERILATPPGSISLKHLKEKCTSCLLCVSNCPTRVIRPSFLEHGIDGIFMPVMDYPSSYCLYECTKCGEVCPTKAIKHFTFEEKKQIQIGRAKLIKEKCIVYKNKTDCGACSEVCPTKAVFMVNYENNLLAPEMEQKYCVGCGSCENACPAKPEKAIYVEGNIVHKKAILRRSIETIEEEQKDFPF